jgi:hypothetical protein
MPFAPDTDPLTDLAASEFVTCKLDHAGTMECVGEAGWTGGPPSGGPFAQVEIDPWTTMACLIGTDETLECYDPRNAPNWVPAWSPAGTFSDVSIGADSVCAVHTDGSAECWGLQTELAAL